MAPGLGGAGLALFSSSLGGSITASSAGGANAIRLTPVLNRAVTTNLPAASLGTGRVADQLRPSESVGCPLTACPAAAAFSKSASRPKMNATSLIFEAGGVAEALTG